MGEGKALSCSRQFIQENISTVSKYISTKHLLIAKGKTNFTAEKYGRRHLNQVGLAWTNPIYVSPDTID